MEQEFQPAAGTAVIDRGAQLLALVLEADAPRALTDLAQDAGLPKSTASRLLSALERNGLVEQQGERGRFRAGPVVLRFAGAASPGATWSSWPSGPMGALADATGETINLGVAGPGGVEHLSQVEGKHFLGTTQWVGRTVPYHCSANGKVLLAYDAVRAPLDGPLEPLTSRTIVDPARLRAELDHDPPRRLRDRHRRARAGAVAPWPRPCSTRTGAWSRRSASPAPRSGSRRSGSPSCVRSSSSSAGHSREQLGHRPEGVHAA